ncbi:MAG: GNAT family N-acetyltransferase [Clostridiales bacterium]|nr:GNAT family N-acetyltransferase [Clostridiales bacterium]
MNSGAELASWHFRRLTRSEWTALYYEQMERDFPPSELKSLELLADLDDRGVNTLWGAYRGETLTGYYVLAQAPGNPALLLDYFAVLPRFRGTGCGGEILRHLRQTLPEGCYLLIESENPQGAANPADLSVRERRVAFYRRNEAALSSATVWLFGVEYVLLTLGAAPSAAQTASDYQALYHYMLPEGRFRDNVRVYLKSDTM